MYLLIHLAKMEALRGSLGDGIRNSATIEELGEDKTRTIVIEQTPAWASAHVV